MVQTESKHATPYWQRSGQGSDLILIHGWGMNGAVWHQTAEQLSEHFRVHVIDLPGFGHSNHLTFNTLEDLSQQILTGAPKNAAMARLVTRWLSCYTHRLKTPRAYR